MYPSFGADEDTDLQSTNIKSDSFVVEMERFSHSSSKNVSPNSRITVCFTIFLFFSALVSGSWLLLVLLSFLFVDLLSLCVCGGTGGVATIVFVGHFNLSDGFVLFFPKENKVLTFL